MERVKTWSAKRIGWVVASTTVLAVSYTTPVLADSPLQELNQAQALLPTGQGILEGIENESPARTEPPVNDPDATEGVALQSLGRDEALGLLHDVFNNVLEGAAGVFDKLEPKRFLSPNVAVIPAGAQPIAPGETPGEARYEGPTLIQSTVPMEINGGSGKDEVIDLSLERSDGKLQSTNSLVEVEVPEQLGEGILLPKAGVRIDLAAVDDRRSPSLVGDSVAGFPNVAQDTDFAVAPTPTGVETFTQLRSADSPPAQTYELTLPQGATLEPERGGAKVVDAEGKVLVGIAPPTALDASGAEVPVDLSISNDMITVTAHIDKDTQLPVLIDPVYQTYEWYANKSLEGLYSYGQGWWYSKANYGCFSYDTEVPNSVFSPTVPYQTPGLYVAALCKLNPKDQGSWNYVVPHAENDPESNVESFITRLTVSNVFWKAESESSSPYVYMGIWGPRVGWVSYYSHKGLKGHTVNDMNWVYTFNNSSGVTDAKSADVGIYSTEAVEKPWSYLYVGSATVELGEPSSLKPGFSSVSGPAKWVDQKALSLGGAVSDQGLGIYAVSVSDESAKHAWKTSISCTGVSEDACPLSWNLSGAKYDSSVLPEGVDYLKITAEDPLGQASEPAYAQVKIDHTDPTLSISGPLSEVAAVGESWPTYRLDLIATDGTKAAPQSGVAKTVIEVDGKPENEVALGCETENCATERSWTLDASKYSTGKHTLKVTATDGVGRSTTKTRTFKLQPAPPPEVALSGTITEQETLGASRPRYGLTVDASTRTPVQGQQQGQKLATTMGSAGSGSGQFKSPQDVAVDISRNLYVLDGGNNRVEEFDSVGNYLGQFGKWQQNWWEPQEELEEASGIALDPAGNIWVSDANGLEEFDSEGRFVKTLTMSSSYSSSKFAIDASGNFWVADRGSNRIGEYDPEGHLMKWLWSPTETDGAFGTGGGPIAVSVDSNDDLWIVSVNEAVYEFSPSGQFLRKIDSHGSGAGDLSRPSDVDVDPRGNVWIADSGNDRIEEFNAEGEYLAQVGSAGSGEGQLSAPTGIDIDLAGRLWVADAGNDRVERWSLPIQPFAPSSAFDASGSTAVAATAEGDFWVADTAHDRLEEFGPEGKYLRQAGGEGSGDGALTEPAGVTVDPEGSVWATDTGGDRVVEYDENGNYMQSFGESGSGEGQLSEPHGIAVNAYGSIWVADSGNDRIERFYDGGEYLGQEGQEDSGSGELSYPTGIALDSRSRLWVADTDNDRIAEFSPSGEYLRSGDTGNIRGWLMTPYGVATGPHGEVWASDYGNNRIKEYGHTGGYFGQFGTPGSGERQFAKPLGIDTTPAGSIAIVDSGNNRIQVWAPSHEVSSEISTEIKVDGDTVYEGSKTCLEEDCSMKPEWTLNSSEYPKGEGTLEVTAIDAVGATTTESLPIKIQPDTTKPELEVSGELAEAPEGWVEQESYFISALAADEGYGVTKMELKIDGTTHLSSAQKCTAGGCTDKLSKWVDMANYSGGAHPAELIATDGAGNKATKRWTINVDPEGHISVQEAADTLEALEETTDANPIGQAQEEDQYYGSATGLGLAQTGDEIVATGSEVPTVIAADPVEGVEMQILPDNSFVRPCETESSSSEEDATLSEDEPESEMAEPTATTCEEENEASDFTLEGIIVSPTETAPTATDNEIIDSQSAVASNTANNVDSVTRPLYEGALTFQNIRDATASEAFTWEVKLTDGQELKLLDSQHAAVYYAGGHPAFGIQAESAHDATGTSVPTKLEVSSDSLLTLRVEHHAGAFVYPVLSGVGWQGGFVSTVVQGPKDEQELKEELERIKREEQEAAEEEEAGEEVSAAVSESGSSFVVNVAVLGPPIADANALDNPEPNKFKTFTFTHKFKFNECRYDKEAEIPVPPSPPDTRREAVKKCQREFTGLGNPKLVAGMAVHGWFHDNQKTNWVWIAKGNLHCDKWGSQQPAMVHCEKRPSSPSHTHIYLFGDYRFAPKNGNFFGTVSACDTIRGRLEVGPTFHQEESVLTPAKINEACSWP